MKQFVLVLLLATFSFAQSTTPALPNAPTPQPPQLAPAFSDTTVTFNLTPISLPGLGQSLSAAETDVILNLTTNNQIGETTLVGTNFTFVGGRYNRIIPQVSNWLNNLSPNLNGMQFQVGVTSSLGVVRDNSTSHWGERAGVFANYAINNTWAMGLDVEANNLPGQPTQHGNWNYSLAFGPSFHF